MLCSKIGGDCPHTVAQDDRFIFVMMPFKGFDNVYDAIQMAVQGIEGKELKCMRADEKYTNFSIWCRNICKNIRKAKYLIADTTGKNPNVFYELGFSHALENTKAILITQNVEDAPFDIADLNHITYSPGNLKDLREKLQKAISELEKEEMDEGYKNKTSDEMMIELRSQLRKEEERASNYKKELHDSEERERKLKERIREIEVIKDDPVKEAKNQITKLEGTIAELKSELKFTEATNREEIDRLNKTLKDKEEKLKTLEVELDGYKQTKETDSLSTLLLDATKKQSEAEKWFSKGDTEYDKGNYKKGIEYYTKAIELQPDDVDAYHNRGLCYDELLDYDRAISDYTKAIELQPDYADAYLNRGLCYDELQNYDQAVSDYNRAIELQPDYADAYENLAGLYIITGKFTDAVNTIKKALALSLEPEERAVSLYLECIAKKILGMDVSECEKEFDKILKECFESEWDFDPIESWLADAGTAIDADKKTFIIEKTELLKKHQK